MRTRSFHKKKKQLGVHPSTAAHHLRKKILFSFVKVLELDDCYRCGKKIEKVENLSIEHKIPWLDSDDPVGLYFDLNNIAFSHIRCNISAARRKKAEHGTAHKYQLGCRCVECKDARSEYRKKYNDRGYKN